MKVLCGTRKRLKKLDIDSIPKDKAHAKYRSAMIHVKKAMEAGKSSDEIHEIYRKVLNSDGTGKCGHKA